MGEQVTLLIFSHENERVALCGDALENLRPFEDGFVGTDFWTASGLVRDDGSSSCVCNIKGSGRQLIIPTPLEYIDTTLDRLLPVPRLIRPMMRVRGISALARLEGTLVAVFDPLSLPFSAGDTEAS